MERAVKLYFDDNTSEIFSTTNIENLNVSDYDTLAGTTSFEVLMIYSVAPTSLMLKPIYSKVRNKKCIKAEFLVDGNVLDKLISTDENGVYVLWKMWYGSPLNSRTPESNVSVLNESVTIRQYID